MSVRIAFSYEYDLTFVSAIDKRSGGILGRLLFLGLARAAEGGESLVGGASRVSFLLLWGTDPPNSSLDSTVTANSTGGTITG